MELPTDDQDTASGYAFDRAARTFRAARDPAACAAVERALLRDIEGAYARAAADGVAFACAAGCAYCCHQRVSVLPHEALALIERLRSLPEAERAEVERRLRANASRVDAMTREEHLRANLACAFLDGGRCRVYDTRPSVCASYHSLDRKRCEQAFARPETLGTPQSSRPALLAVQRFCDAVVAATEAGVRDAGLATERLELSTALRALLDRPELAARWATGDALEISASEEARRAAGES